MKNKNIPSLDPRSKGYKIEIPSLAIIYVILAIVAGLILPALLIPLVEFIGYSEIVEEIAKALVVLFLILKLPSYKMKILVGIGVGFLFGLSENMFYLNNIFQFSDFSVFWQRFLWTVPMHIITVLVMIFASLAKKWFLIFGFIGAVIIHVLFNSLVVSMLIG